MAAFIQLVKQGEFTLYGPKNGGGGGFTQHYSSTDVEMVLAHTGECLDKVGDKLWVFLGTVHDERHAQLTISSRARIPSSFDDDIVGPLIFHGPELEAWEVFKAYARML